MKLAAVPPKGFAMLKLPPSLVSAAASIALVLLMSTAHAAGEGSEWRQFRGPRGQGIGQAAGVPTTWAEDRNLLWKTALPGPGGSGAVVFGDRIVLTSYSGYAVPGVAGGDIAALKRQVICLQRDTGKVLWTRDIAAEQPEEPKVRDHGYASSTPLVDAERVYVFLGKTGVLAFDHDGTERWRTLVGSKTHGWGSATSPVLYRDLVIINASVESDSLVALDRRTGKEVWRAAGMKESWNTPILVPVEGGREELVVAVFGKVLGFDPATGEALWSCATGIGWYMVPGLVNDRDVVCCIGGRTGGSLAVRAGGRGDVTQTRRLWTLNKGSNVSSPLLHGGHLYWLHENLGIAYCVEVATGKLVYGERLPKASQFYASPILVDGRIHAVDRQGATFLLAAQPRFELIGRNDLRDRSSFDASPSLDGNRLLLRSDRFLYCVGGR